MEKNINLSSVPSIYIYTICAIHAYNMSLCVNTSQECGNGHTGVGVYSTSAPGDPETVIYGQILMNLGVFKGMPGFWTTHQIIFLTTYSVYVYLLNTMQI